MSYVNFRNGLINWLICVGVKILVPAGGPKILSSFDKQHLSENAKQPKQYTQESSDWEVQYVCGYWVTVHSSGSVSVFL